MQTCRHNFLFLCLLIAGQLGAPPAARAQTPPPAPAKPPLVILVTHPMPATLHYYVTLVRQHILNFDNIKLVGIHHAAEREDYAASEAYLAREKIDWIEMRTVKCKLPVGDIFADNACRAEFADLIGQSDGIIFNGGPDIPPSLYNRPTKLTTIIETPHRHYFELSLLAHLLGTKRNTHIVPLIKDRPHYAILAICVGMQSLNVADGGSLVQDIPSEVYHERSVEEIARTPSNWHRSAWAALDPEPSIAAGVFHPIRLTPKAPPALRLLLSAPSYAPQVLSIHHQAVGRLGGDYVVTATSADGKVVEGIAHKKFDNVVGWQFHPERSVLWDKNEVGRMHEESPDNNFAYTLMQQDQHSRAFALAIWQQFSEAVQQEFARRTAAPGAQQAVP